MGDDTIGLLFMVVIILILFFVLREFFCWYWKINKVVTLLTNIDTNLEKISSKSLMLYIPEEEPPPPSWDDPNLKLPK
jgi:hypothetical protein